VLFTEIGYPSQDGVNRHPWESGFYAPLDLQEQADLYQALLQTFYNQSWFAGVYFFPWETDPFMGGPCDLTATPHDKPAEDVLRQWYGAQPRPVMIPNYRRSMPIYLDALATGWDSWSWGGIFDFASTLQVHNGMYAISAETPSWAGIALHHETFDSSPYYWLELYVYKSSDASSVYVWVNDADDQPLPGRLAEDCRYTDGQPLTPGAWTRVRIPLKDLQANSRMLQRVSIGNAYDQPFTYYVDDIRLVGAVRMISPEDGSDR
jgi:hypothetical protein